MVREVDVATNLSGDVHVEVKNDGFIAVSGLTAFKDTGISPSLAIWKNYQNYRSGDAVVRSGHGLCGVYEFNPDEPIQKNYVENDTMHSTTAEEIAQNIFRYYPGLFKIGEQKRIVSFLRYHDLGETKNGDKPDDGSSQKSIKVEAELCEFIKQIQYLPSYEQIQLIHDFIIFEDAANMLWPKADRQIMQFAKLCDKTDALLAALLFETQGRGGALSYKQEHFNGITQQDSDYVEAIGEDSQAAVWTAHMLDTYRYYEFLDIFAGIIIAAVKDVRGEVFPGLREFLEAKKIFDKRVTDRLLSD